MACAINIAFYSGLELVLVVSNDISSRVHFASLKTTIKISVSSPLRPRGLSSASFLPERHNFANKLCRDMFLFSGRKGSERDRETEEKFRLFIQMEKFTFLWLFTISLTNK
jgi:hypothetical protein